MHDSAQWCAQESDAYRRLLNAKLISVSSNWMHYRLESLPNEFISEIEMSPRILRDPTARL